MALWFYLFSSPFGPWYCFALRHPFLLETHSTLHFYLYFYFYFYFYFHPPLLKSYSTSYPRCECLPRREDARQDRATLLDPDGYHRQAGSWRGLLSDCGSYFSLFQLPHTTTTTTTLATTTSHPTRHRRLLKPPTLPI